MLGPFFSVCVGGGGGRGERGCVRERGDGSDGGGGAPDQHV